MTTRKALQEGERVFHEVCRIVVELDRKMLEEIKTTPIDPNPDVNLAYAKGVHEAFKRLVGRFNQEIDNGVL